MSRRAPFRRMPAVAGVVCLLLSTLLGVGSPRAVAQITDPSLQLTLLTSDTAPDAGASFTYTLNYRCAGITQNCTHVVINAVLPVELATGAGDVSMVGDGNTVTSSYNPATRTVTFNQGDRNAGDAGQLAVAVHYPGGTTPIGTLATATASISATNATTVNATGVSTTSGGAFAMNLSKSGPSDEDLGVGVGYTIQVCSPGSFSLVGGTIVDTLPAGATLLSSSQPAGVGAASHVGDTLTWTLPDPYYPAGGYGACDQFGVQARYDAPTFADLQTVTNGAVLSGTAFDTAAAVTRSDTAGTTLHEPVAALSGSKSGPVWFTPGQAVSYTLSADSTGHLPLSNVVIDDSTLPTEFAAATAVITAAQPSSLAIDYRVNGSGALDHTDVLGPYASGATVNLSAPGGTYIGGLRVTLPAMAPISSASLRIDGTVRAARPDGSTVADTDTATNCATFSSTESTPGSPSCVTSDVQVNFAQPVLTKSAPGGPFEPGDTVHYAITVANQSPASAALNDLVVADLVDSRLTYVTNSADDSEGTAAITETLQGDGRTLVRWDFSASHESLAPGASLTLTYDAVVPTLLEAGTTVPNRAALLSYVVPGSPGNLIYPCDGAHTVAESILGYDFDGTASDVSYCATGLGEGNASITGVPNMSSRKWVRGELDTLAGRNGTVDGGGDDLPGPDGVAATADDGYNRYPDSGRTLAGGRMDYRLIVTNESNVPVKDFTIIDVLPFVGDTATLSSTARATAWRPFLVAPVVLAGFDVYYSVAANPCRPEVGYSGGGCAAANWTATFPAADPTAVTALKLVKVDDPATAGVDESRIGPAGAVDIAISLRAQAHSSNGTVAWNSFAYAWTRADTNAVLLPSEPLKVGIEVVGDTRNGIGDRVWLDLDRDGLQDVQESGFHDVNGDGINSPTDTDITWDDRDGDDIQDPEEASLPFDRAIGINGVPVGLYADTNTDGVPSAGDTLLQSTYTHTDFYGTKGVYWFPNLAEGDYFVAFTPPAGYTVSPSDAGSDDAIDSDATANGAFTGKVVTAVTHLGPNEFDPHWDLGLWSAAATRTSLGNRVWFDSDANGRQDAGSGVSGVQVNLLDGSGNAVRDPAGTALTVHTDTNGKYRFDWLIPGTYRVEFVAATLPSGFRFTRADVGADDSADSDVDPTNGRTASITLAAPPSNPNSYGTTADNVVDPRWDAGITPRHSVGDYVWFDTDADGVQDGGESPVGGVTVNVYDAGADAAVGGGDDSLAATAVTTGTSTGLYGFTNLLSGTYFVTFTPPAGTVASPANAGADDTVDADGVTNAAYPGQLVSPVVTLTTQAGIDATLGTDDDTGQNDPTLDQGLYRLVSIGDRAWTDTNANGTQDGGEPSIDGLSVRLYHPGATPTLVATASTAGGGLYNFTGLTPGDYVVAFQPPAGHLVTVNTGAVAATNSDVTLRTSTLLDSANVDLNGWALTPTVSRATQAGTDNRFGTADDVTTDPTWDAGFYQTVSIGDRVWFDADGDGVQGGGEHGVADISVTLLDGSGSAVANPANSVSPWVLSTDGSGHYLFDGLRPGTYSVRFDLADPDLDAHWIPALRNAGADDAVDSDADRASGRTPNTTLGSGQSDLTLDAGFVLKSGVGDFVWNDTNADGKQDAGEPGIANVRVELWTTGADNAAGTGDDARVTLADGVTNREMLTTVDGAYLFTGLLPGRYFVKIDRSTLPADYRVSPANQGSDDAIDSDAVTDPTNAGRLLSSIAVIGVDAEILTLDIGVFLPASIGGIVWEDENGSGIQLPSESLLGQSVTVVLRDAAGEPVFSDVDGGPIVPSVTPGTYLFQNLRPGTYRLSFTVPTGWTMTGNDHGSDDELDSDPSPSNGRTVATVLDSGETDLSWDGGYYRAVALGDLIWFDLDDDGLQDPGEVGAPGITVRLLDAGRAADGTGSVLGTATTDAAGHYGFSGLVPGTYQVCVTLPNTMWPSPLDIGTDNALDSDANPTSGCMAAVTLHSGESDLTLDAGIFDDAEVGDLVWEDRDLDGLQDSGEPGVAGVQLRLLGPGVDGAFDGNDIVVATTVTDPDGGYRFRGLLPATYRVVAEPTTFPPSLRLTPLDRGADDSHDSDAALDSGLMAPVTLGYGQTDLTFDAGLVTPLTLRLTKELLGELVAGQQTSYRLTVTNDGPGQAWAGVTMTDPLPSGLTYVSAGGDGWSCTASTTDVVTCARAATLAAGASSSVELVARVADSASGQLVNAATVSAPGLTLFSTAQPTASVQGEVLARRDLARTGTDTGRLLWFGAGLVLLGMVLTIPVRRRLR